MNKPIDSKLNNILFVCSSNVCRSVIAEALLKDKLNNDRTTVQSAGIYATNGSFVLPNTERILEEREIEYTEQSKPVTVELLQKSDLILTMTRSQKYILMSKIPEIENKIFTLKEYVGKADNLDIDIPAENLDSYRRCLEDIDSALDILVDKINGDV